ncbi:MAG: GTPase HflX [Clostridium sp.]|jgi:GTP-binding protein HflX|nr:GTPase HflX [Clostridium sp.]
MGREDQAGKIEREEKAAENMEWENQTEAFRTERALLVGADIKENSRFAEKELFIDFERSMEELGGLAEACGMEVAGRMTQKLEGANKTFYIGTGKVKELKQFAESCEADVVVFDNTLSPSQIRNLGEEVGRPILDRTALILDIFRKRARTREAKLQVEAARLQYLLPRLVGMHQALSRQGGTGGSMSSKGAGEKKLELDKRKIQHRLHELQKDLEDLETDRATQRKQREDSRLPQVALVGYTNSGKSTVMNRFLELCGESAEKQVLEKDLLFATLDTSVRKIDMGDRRPFLLIDTVGFIHKLPHGLVQAFRSTLEEVKYADLLVQVIDFSDENYRQQMDVTGQTLRSLDAGDIPMIYVYNKCDRKVFSDCRDREPSAERQGGHDEPPRPDVWTYDFPVDGGTALPWVKDDRIYLSAGNGTGIGELAQLIKRQIYSDREDATFLIPYRDGKEASYLMENATVLSQSYEEEGVRLKVSCHSRDVGKLSRYRVG